MRLDADQPARALVTLRLGLIGHPVAHSRSPAMQQAALDALGIPARYELWDTPPDELPARVAALRGPDMLGANVTIPYKAAVVPLLDGIAPQAQRAAAGVVNTIVRDETSAGARLVGHNTDVTALVRILDEGAVWSEQRCVVVLGAGGAAQAALGASRQRGAEVWVAARRLEAAQAALNALWSREHEDAPGGGTRLPEAWHRRAVTLADHTRLAEALSRADVLLQATLVGMGNVGDGETSSLPLALLDHLPAHAFVFDLVYAPPETALVRAARGRGLRASGGLPMLLYQGAAAFTLWTGQEAPLAVMRTALRL